MVITKSPADISLEQRQYIERRYARIFPHRLFFAIIKYGEPLAVFPTGSSLSTDDIKHYDVLLITGIANPKPFEAYISLYAASVQTVNFPDHHAFSTKDINRIAAKWNNIQSANKILLTTEKDAVRIQEMEIPEAIARNSYYTPIEVDLMGTLEIISPMPLTSHESLTSLKKVNK
jgi:tetraacyldisaccharide 4'-kinase